LKEKWNWPVGTLSLLKSHQRIAYWTTTITGDLSKEAQLLLGMILGCVIEGDSLSIALLLSKAKDGKIQPGYADQLYLFTFLYPRAIRPIRDDDLRISESRGSKDQAQVEAALQNDRAHREVMEAGLSRLVQQLLHNAQAIQQTLTNERDSGVKIPTALQFFT